MSKPSRRPVRPRARQPQPYSHRQFGRALSGLIAIPLVVSVMSLFSHPDYRASLAGLIIILGAALVIFSTLSTLVTDEWLVWQFGPGPIRKKVAVAEIASVELVRTSFIDGLGIHYTRYGWLYNVGGRDAVAIMLTSGKRFAIGSDDAVGLWEALQARLPEPVANDDAQAEA